MDKAPYSPYPDPDVNEDYAEPGLDERRVRRPRRRGFLAGILGWFSGLFRFVLASTLFFVLLVVVSYWAVAHFVSGKELAAPNVMGKTMLEAAKLLDGKDYKGYMISLKWEREQPVEAVPEGQIVSQFPAPGSRIKAGTPIRVVTSAGVPLVMVPDLRGKSKSEAGVSLRNLGLDVGNISVLPTPPGTAAGVVLETDPPGKTGVPQGSKVSLFVTTSLTQAAQALTMPDLRGKTVDQASSVLGPLGLFVAEERRGRADGVPPGQIHAQSPQPGEPVSETTRIIVTYAPPETEESYDAPAPRDESEDTSEATSEPASVDLSPKEAEPTPLPSVNLGGASAEHETRGQDLEQPAEAPADEAAAPADTGDTGTAGGNEEQTAE